MGPHPSWFEVLTHSLIWSAFFHLFVPLLPYQSVSLLNDDRFCFVFVIGLRRATKKATPFALGWGTSYHSSSCLWSAPFALSLNKSFITDEVRSRPILNWKLQNWNLKKIFFEWPALMCTKRLHLINFRKINNL